MPTSKHKIAKSEYWPRYRYNNNRNRYKAKGADMLKLRADGIIPQRERLSHKFDPNRLP